MIEKEQEVSSHRSAYKVHHKFHALFSWYTKNPDAKHGVESKN